MASELTSDLNAIDSDNRGKLFSAKELNTTAKPRKTKAEYQKAYREREKAKKNKNKQESTAKPPKTKAEYQKAYRERQKAKKNENKQESTTKPPKTNAENQKAFRERQKMKKIKNKRESNAELNAPSKTKKKTQSEHCKEYQQKSRLKKQRVQLDALLFGESEVPQSKKIKLIDIQNVTNKKFIMRHNEILTDHIESSKELRPSPYSTYAPTFLELDLAEPLPEPDVKPFLQSPWFSLSQPRTAEPVHDDSSSSAFDPDENASYFQFFRGLYPDYQELSARKQRQFRRQCLSFLHQLLDEEDRRRDDLAQDGAGEVDAMNLSSSHVSDEEDSKLGVMTSVVTSAGGGTALPD